MSDQCPHCGGPTEWMEVESVHGKGYEDVLVCHECGELVRWAELDVEGTPIDFEFSSHADEDYEDEAREGDIVPMDNFGRWVAQSTGPRR